MRDFVLYAAFPYAAVALAVAVTVYRYRMDRFSFTSRSSQFLEGRYLFWGSVPWHFAIGAILLAHILAAVFPGAWASLLGSPLRLVVVEVTGLALGLAATAGIAVLCLRRLANARLAAITGPLDWLILLVLLVQTGSGVYVAWTYRWGAAWYLHTAAPWFESLARLAPEPSYVAMLPLAAKIHLLNAFVLVALFPFSRLVHVVSVPLGYLFRPHQLVIWNRRSREEVVK